MAVDIGAEAVNRFTGIGSRYTRILKDHPATANGIITSVDIWANTAMTGLRVGTFYTTNGNTLKCRDSEAIPGTITAGSKVTKEVSIAVEIGDYIGAFWSAGSIDMDLSGFDGLWNLSGEYIDPGDEATYGFTDNRTISLGGYIEGAPVVVGHSQGYIFG